MALDDLLTCITEYPVQKAAERSFRLVAAGENDSLYECVAMVAGILESGEGSIDGQRNTILWQILNDPIPEPAGRLANQLGGFFAARGNASC